MSGERSDSPHCRQPAINGILRHDRGCEVIMKRVIGRIGLGVESLQESLGEESYGLLDIVSRALRIFENIDSWDKRAS
jgi:hypothetical protein